MSDYNPFLTKQMKLWGELWDEEDNSSGRPTANISLVNNVPRFFCYLNNNLDANAFKEQIRLSYNPKRFFVLMEAFKDIINTEGGGKLDFPVTSRYPLKGRQTEKSEGIGGVVVGKGGDGICYIVIYMTDERPAIFKFIPPFFESIIDADGSPLDAQKASRLEALGFINMVTEMMATALVTRANDPAESQGIQGGGYNQNNNNQSRGNQARGNQSSGGFDKDIPF